MISYVIDDIEHNNSRIGVGFYDYDKFDPRSPRISGVKEVIKMKKYRELVVIGIYLGITIIHASVSVSFHTTSTI